jgi:hypothetical protein
MPAGRRKRLPEPASRMRTRGFTLAWQAVSIGGDIEYVRE